MYRESRCSSPFVGSLLTCSWRQPDDGYADHGIIWTVLPLDRNTFATNPVHRRCISELRRYWFVDAIAERFLSPVPEVMGQFFYWSLWFGAWFIVLLQTGIADALIRKAVELGGDKPVIICVLALIVTTAIFSTLFGAGAVVAIE